MKPFLPVLSAVALAAGLPAAEPKPFVAELKPDTQLDSPTPHAGEAHLR